MPEVHRVTDMRSQHGSANETACLIGSPNVFCNGLAVQRALVDNFATHGSSPAHQGYVKDAASLTVFVNGYGVARVGDDVFYPAAGNPNTDICPSICIGPGSTNVFAGG